MFDDQFVSYLAKKMTCNNRLCGKYPSNQPCLSCQNEFQQRITTAIHTQVAATANPPA